MVYVTGDCHADFGKFSVRHFPEQRKMSRGDIVIVCGDFGLWHNDAAERGRLEGLARRAFTIVFVDGNHENFDRLYSDEFPTVDFYGGKAHRIRENIYHLKRGYVFEFEGKSFFAFGGAKSHDISDGILDRKDFASDDEFKRVIRAANRLGLMCRVNHISWWKQELPTREEMDFGKAQLAAHGNKVDFIISHCCPQTIASINGYTEPDILTQYFDEIARDNQFDKWFFGHYHDNRTTYLQYVMRYDKIERVL